MSEEKITIPQEDIDTCRALCKKAHECGLYEFSGKFTPKNWGADVSFSWKLGRHGEDFNRIEISSNVFTIVKINDPKA